MHWQGTSQNKNRVLGKGVKKDMGDGLQHTIRLIQILNLHFQHEVHDERVEAVQQLLVSSREAEFSVAQHPSAADCQQEQACEECQVWVLARRFFVFNQPLKPPEHLHMSYMS